MPTGFVWAWAWAKRCRQCHVSREPGTEFFAPRSRLRRLSSSGGSFRRRESPYQQRRIEIEVRLGLGRAVFVIRDEGPGFDPAALPDPTDPANLEKITGRGYLLMQAFMDHVDFNDRGNEVTMVKKAAFQRPVSGAN